MNRPDNRVAVLVTLLCAALLLSACEPQRPAYALTSTGRILGFDVSRPDKLDSNVAVSGLASDESLVQLDYRPANDAYYGLTSKARLCRIDPQTGAATQLGAAGFTSATLVNPVIDFNPVADHLRVIASEQNLRAKPNDGTLDGTDTKVFYDSGDVNHERTAQLAAIAYDRNISGASVTTLFALDVATQSLVRIGSKNGSPDSPNTGRLFTIASLPVAFTSTAGFDIEPGGDTAYVALAASGAGAVLYRLGLDSATTDRVDAIGKGDRTIISLAVGPEKSASSSP